MESEKTAVPYIVHEGTLARLERSNRRLVYALIMTIILGFASNAMWLWAWVQYDYEGEDVTTTTKTVTRTIDVDGGSGVASYIGGSGNIIHGSDNSDYDGLYDECEETEEAEAEEEWDD